MIPNEKEKIDEILTALAEMFEIQLSEQRLDLYFAALTDMSFEQFKESANRVARTSRFFPKPVDFRESISEKTEDLALAALAKLEDTRENIGGWSSVVFDDCVIHRVVSAMGGWVAICDMPWSDWKFARKDFVKMYSAFAAKDNMQTPTKLYGRHDINNEKMGYLAAGRVKEYIEYIGDKVKALEWTGNQRKEIENINKIIERR